MDVLDLWYRSYFCLQLRKGFEYVKKTKQLNQELVNSLVNNTVVEIEELNKQAGKVDDH